MNEIVLRNLDGDTVTKLAARAVENRRSLEQEIADVLRQAMANASKSNDRREDAARLVALAREIAAMTPPGVAQTDSVVLIREDRDR